MHMRTNIEIDEDLLAEAMALTGARTKRDAVDQALKKLIQIKRQADIRKLWGIGWEGDLDEMRRNK